MAQSFNFDLTAGPDQEILPAQADRKNRVRQLNIQNRGGADGEVTVKKDGATEFGPLLVPSKGAVSLELLTDTDNDCWIIDSPKNVNLSVDLTGGGPYTVFGKVDIQ